MNEDESRTGHKFSPAVRNNSEPRHKQECSQREQADVARISSQYCPLLSHNEQRRSLQVKYRTQQNADCYEWVDFEQSGPSAAHESWHEPGTAQSKCAQQRA